MAVTDGKKPPTLPGTAEPPNVLATKPGPLVLGAIMEHATRQFTDWFRCGQIDNLV
jgi:hypothetical protein